MYKLILIVYLAAGGGNGTSQQVIGQYPTKQACSEAANDALFINRVLTATALGWSFICVSVPGP